MADDVTTVAIEVTAAGAVKGLRQVADGLERAANESGDLDGSLTKMSAVLAGTATKLEGVAKAAGTQAAGFDVLLAQQKKVVAGYRNMAQAAAVAGKSPQTALSSAETPILQKTVDASSADNFGVTNIKAELAARQKAAAAEAAAQIKAERAIQAEQARTFNQGLAGLSRNVAASVAAAREREAAEESANRSILASQASIASSRSGGIHDAEVASLGRLVVAENEAARAAEHLAVAQAAVEHATSSGDVYAQAAAYETLATAERSALIATREVTAATAAARQGLATQRYALYDVAQVTGVASAALIALAAVPIATAVSFEKSFANVKRTVEGANLPATADKIQASFINLTKTIPQSFENISAIGALGGQLGVSASAITNFTKVTAEFSATTNVGIEASGTALGRLSTLISGADGKYAQLASSILKTGVASVATESQIISVSQQIASTASASGYAADQVIGLASAFASLGVAPELARSTTVTTFGKINAAISSGGDALNNFAKVSGMTSKQFAASWQNDASGTFVKFVQGISTNGAEAQKQLAALGLSSLRTAPTLQKLANSPEVLTKALSDASKGFNNTSVLTNQYGKIAETVSSQLVILKNNVAALAQSFGVLGGGPLAAVVGFLSKFINTLTILVNNPAGRIVAGLITGFSALAGVLGVVATATLLTVAAQNALKTAIQGTSIATATTGLRGFAAAMILDTTATGAAAVATNILGFALKALPFVGIGLALVGIVGAIIQYSTAANSAHSATQAYNVDLTALAGTFKIVDGNARATTSTLVALNNAINTAGTGGDGAKYKALAVQLNVLGIDIAGLAPKIAAGGAPLDAVRQKLQAMIKAGTGIAKIAGGAGQASTSYTTFSKKARSAQDALDLLNGTAKKYAKTAEAAERANTTLAKQTAKTSNGFRETGTAAKGAATSLNKYASSAVKSIDSGVKLQGNLYALGQSLAENGKNFSKFSAAGRANLGALQTVADNIISRNGSDVQKSINQIAALYNFISKNAEVPKAQLKSLLVLQEALENSSGLSVQAGKNDNAKQFKSLAAGVADYTAAQVGSGGGGGGATGASDASGDAMDEAGKKADEYRKTISKATAEIDKLQKKMAVTDTVIAANAVLQGANTVKLIASKAALLELKAEYGRYADTLKTVNKGIAALQKQNDATDVQLSHLQRQYDTLGTEIDKYNAAIAANDATLSASARTTADYASDISSIMTDAFNIDFGGITAYKAVSDGWTAIGTAADQANTSVQSAYQTLNDLQASDAVLQYQLGVANEFGDTGRAAELNAQIGSNHAQQTTAQQTVTTSQAAVTSSTDTSQLVGMTSDYGALIQQYISAGYTGDALKAVIDNLTNQFQTNGAALGFTGDQMAQFISYLQTYKNVADTVPAATISFQISYDGNGYTSMDGITQSMTNSLDQWITGQDRTWLLGVGLTLPDGSSGSFSTWWGGQVAAFTSNNSLHALLTVDENAQATIASKQTALQNLEAGRTALISVLQDEAQTLSDKEGRLKHLEDARKSQISVLQDDKGTLHDVETRLTDLEVTRIAKVAADADSIAKANEKLGTVISNLNSISGNHVATVTVNKNVNTTKTTSPKTQEDYTGKGKWTGGYAGDGGKYEPMGTYHGGEFIMNKKATQNIGVDTLYSLQAGAQRGTAQPIRNSNGGASVVSGGSNVTQLSATDRGILNDIVNAQALYLDGQNIAQNQSARNVQTTRRGSN